MERLIRTKSIAKCMQKCQQAPGVIEWRGCGQTVSGLKTPFGSARNIGQANDEGSACAVQPHGCRMKVSGASGSPRSRLRYTK